MRATKREAVLLYTLCALSKYMLNKVCVMSVDACLLMHVC